MDAFCQIWCRSQRIYTLHKDLHWFCFRRLPWRVPQPTGRPVWEPKGRGHLLVGPVHEKVSKEKSGLHSSYLVGGVVVVGQFRGRKLGREREDDGPRVAVCGALPSGTPLEDLPEERIFPLERLGGRRPVGPRLGRLTTVGVLGQQLCGLLLGKSKRRVFPVTPLPSLWMRLDTRRHTWGILPWKGFSARSSTPSVTDSSPG